MIVPKKKSKTFTTVSVIAITLIIALLSNWFQFSAEKAVLNSALREMEEIGALQEYALEHEIEVGIKNLSLLAEHISKNNITTENVVDFFNSQAFSPGISELYYIDVNGNAMGKDGVSRNFYNNESFINAFEHEYFIGEPHISFEQEKIMFSISLPIKKDTEIIGVLMQTITMDNFFESYQEKTNDRGDVFIVDKHLNFYFSTSESHSESHVVPESDIKEMGIDNIISAQNNISSHISGSFPYDYYGTSKAMAYMPIKMTNWALAINIETEEINSELVTAVDQLRYICQWVYWFLIALILYIWLSQSRSMKILEKTAFYDSLTGLPNLIKFQALVEEQLTENPDVSFTMQKMDIVRFQGINETFGFESGNLVLKKIAETINTIEEKTFIATRISVDEFLMFSGNGFLDDDGSTRDLYENAFKSLIPELGNHEFTFKYGRYFIEKGETDVIDIINKTSLAHSFAKQNSHIKTADYNDAFRKSVLKSTEILNKKKLAIQNEEFKIFLQPKFNVFDGSLVGAEALVRWIEADGTMIFPNDFIPLFEKTGFIAELDKYMLKRTCEVIKKWITSDFGHIAISVNLSRVNLNNPKIVENIIEIVDSYNIPHEYIEIELTESASQEQEETLETLYGNLHKSGFQTAIDDFGAGYSSLGMLKSLNIDTLKMDRSFFVNNKLIRRDDMLINGIIKMSHSLGMHVVAEGIETAEQIEMLKSMNCDTVQGYFYSKPISIKEFEETYKEIMPNKLPNNKTSLQLIKSINDNKFATSFIPCGIIVTKINEGFTIIEANNGFFNLIGYTREEVFSIYKNRGIDIIHPDDRSSAIEYLMHEIKTNPTGELNLSCRFATKNNGYKTAHLGSRVDESENGQYRLYISIFDISSYIENNNIKNSFKHKKNS